MREGPGYPHIEAPDNSPLKALLSHHADASVHRQDVAWNPAVQRFQGRMETGKPAKGLHSPALAERSVISEEMYWQELVFARRIDDELTKRVQPEPFFVYFDGPAPERIQLVDGKQLVEHRSIISPKGVGHFMWQEDWHLRALRSAPWATKHGLDLVELVPHTQVALRESMQVSLQVVAELAGASQSAHPLRKGAHHAFLIRRLDKGMCVIDPQCREQ